MTIGIDDDTVIMGMQLLGNISAPTHDDKIIKVTMMQFFKRLLDNLPQKGIVRRRAKFRVLELSEIRPVTEMTGYLKTRASRQGRLVRLRGGKAALVKVTDEWNGGRTLHVKIVDYKRLYVTSGSAKNCASKIVGFLRGIKGDYRDMLMHGNGEFESKEIKTPIL